MPEQRAQFAFKGKQDHIQGKHTKYFLSKRKYYY